MFRGNKRGQLTIFIIAAILIVAGVVMFFVFRGDVDKLENIPEEVNPIYIYIVSCLEETSDFAFKEIYQQGGYYEVPSEILFEYFTKDYPYYYINSENHIPKIEDVEREFGNYISDRIENCLDFETFENQGYDIQTDEISASFNIKEGYVDVELDFPLIISKGDFSTEISEFKVRVDSNLKGILDLSGIILEDYSINPGFICLTCLEEYNTDTEFSVSSQAINYGDEVFLFSIYDSQTEFNWRFVVEK